MSCAIVWFRRDLRLADNPALQAALEVGHAPIPVYIHAPAEESPWSPGAASQAWLHRSLLALDADLRRLGSRLLIRTGATLAELEKLCAEADAEAVYWNRLYEPATIARDTGVKQALRARGLHVQTGNAAFIDGAARGYKEQRNFPDRAGSSLLSPHLHFGELSPRQIRARLMATQRPSIPEADSSHYLSE